MAELSLRQETGQHPVIPKQDCPSWLTIYSKISTKILSTIGDILAINEQSIHRLTVDHPDTLARVVQFPVHILLPTVAAIKPLQPHIPLAEITAVPGLQSSLDHLFEIMDREHRVPLSEHNPFLQSLCSAAYFLLMRHFAAEEASIASGNERNEFYRVVEFINRNYTSHINIQTVAAALYIPRGRLARLFRKYAGMDLNEYINTLRIKQVNQMLLQGCRITEAATESGFQSIRTFNNLYRLQTGMTPSEYLRSIQES
jgi:AraC-like DNA-binding protein